MKIVRIVVDSALVLVARRYRSHISRTVLEMKRYWQPADIANALSSEYKRDPNINEPLIPLQVEGFQR